MSFIASTRPGGVIFIRWLRTYQVLANERLLKSTICLSETLHDDEKWQERVDAFVALMTCNPKIGLTTLVQHVRRRSRRPPPPHRPSTTIHPHLRLNTISGLCISLLFRAFFHIHCSWQSLAFVSDPFVLTQYPFSRPLNPFRSTFALKFNL